VSSAVGRSPDHYFFFLNEEGLKINGNNDCLETYSVNLRYVTQMYNEVEFNVGVTFPEK
jgi:hypothetical protein